MNLLDLPFLLAVALALALTGFGFFIWQKRKKSREEKEYQKIFFRSVVQIMEFDRQKIAKDLHDEAGSSLSIIKMNLSKMEGDVNIAGKSKVLVTESKKMVDHLITFIRRVSQDLMPATLLKLGYSEAMVELARIASLAGITKVRAEITTGQRRFYEVIELEAYRAVQEVLNNILKHAAATEVLILVRSEANELITVIRHDGIGLNMEDVERLINEKKGMGLSAIKKRLELIDGSIEYRTSEARNSEIIIRIPIHEEN